MFIATNRMLGDIREFHERFELTYDGPPRDLPSDLSSFRQTFLAEEVEEYAIAEEVHDREMMLDALVDLVYVALGTAYLHGFDFAEAWRRVHEANMQKIRAERPSDSKRGSVYDVVKPEGWQAPNLKDLIE